MFKQTVYEDIAFGPSVLKMLNMEEKVKESMEFVGLNESFKNRNPFELSGGEKRKVAIAGVIATNPKILILDEPTVGLDSSSKKDILKKIKNYNKKTSNTIIIVSHDVNIIAQYVDKVLILDNGKIAKYDTVDNIFSNPNELEKLDIEFPEIPKIFQKLNSNKIKVNTNIYTIEQAKKELLLLNNTRKE